MINTQFQPGWCLFLKTKKNKDYRVSALLHSTKIGHCVHTHERTVLVQEEMVDGNSTSAKSILNRMLNKDMFEQCVTEYEQDILPYLKNATGKKHYGVPTLSKRIKQYRLHRRLLEESYENVLRSIRYITKETTPNQKQSYKKRSLQAKARDVFSSLSPTLLQAQCTALGIDYTAYQSNEEVVNILVDTTLANAVQ